MNTKVDEFLDKTNKWQEELRAMRTLILECGLTEEFKWKHPCYTFQQKNVIIIHGFKDYCALLFFKGALLNDSHHLLIQQTENVQAGRQIRFTDIEEIRTLSPLLKAYIFEAIEVERAGLKIKKKDIAQQVPEELQDLFDQNPALEKAFYALTPGRQRAYILHFSAPKQSKTSITRIENNIPRILLGKGLHDCICGLSKRFPTCDGSHKNASVENRI